MKVNKTILIGILFILLGGIIFLTDALNPIIRPITYLFLMGSSKGKDIMFFGIFGLILILSQIIPKNDDSKKYLKISIAVGSILLISGILLEVIFRYQMGIKLNTVFCSMGTQMSSTSILHTHLLKAVLGQIISTIMGPFIQNNINTGVGLYQYLPNYSFLIITLIPILFITIILASQKKLWFTNLLMAFFSSCLLIGIIDGGMFATPSYIGIFGLYLIYRNGYYINHFAGIIIHDEQLIKDNELNQPPYRNINLSEIRYLFNRFLVYLVIGLIILLRFTIAFAGAECDYYTVEVANPTGNISLGQIDPYIISHEHDNNTNITTYKINSTYNEMALINDLKIPLNNSCEYYTVSWNIYSYFY